MDSISGHTKADPCSCNFPTSLAFHEPCMLRGGYPGLPNGGCFLPRTLAIRESQTEANVTKKLASHVMVIRNDFRILNGYSLVLSLNPSTLSRTSYPALKPVLCSVTCFICGPLTKP